MDSLLSLPGGASFTDHKGQASLSVKRQGGSATEPEYIYVEATCDSLMLQCERYERTIRNLRHSLTEQSGRMKRSLVEEACSERVEKPPAKTFGTGLALGLGIGLGCCLLRYLDAQRQKG